MLECGDIRLPGRTNKIMCKSRITFIYVIKLCRRHCDNQPNVCGKKVDLPGNKILLIMPGNTMKKSGRILRYPANIAPAFAWDRFFAARTLCTITCCIKKSSNHPTIIKHCCHLQRHPSWHRNVYVPPEDRIKTTSAILKWCLGGPQIFQSSNNN